LGDGAVRSFRVVFLKAQNSLQQGKEQGISQRFSAKICLETSANAGANRSARPDEAFTRAIASAQQLPSPAASAAHHARPRAGHSGGAAGDMNDDPVFAARAIEAGAKGYIAKNDDPLLFADAVRRVAGGGVYLRPEVAREVAFIRVGPGANPLSHLSARELEILRLLAGGNSMTQIAHVLNVSYKTVANNCTALKHKLGARSAMDLMRIAVDSATSSTHRAR
jgi:DNA-binding NarL/FixJ family response regulator